jgi:hypothetical protein
LLTINLPIGDSFFFAELKAIRSVGGHGRHVSQPEWDRNSRRNRKIRLADPIVSAHCEGLHPRPFERFDLGVSVTHGFKDKKALCQLGTAMLSENVTAYLRRKMQYA